MNKRLGDMTIEELCDEMVTRAKEQCVLPAVIVNMYAGCIKDENARLRALVKEMLSHIEELYQCQSPCDGRCLRQKESCEFRARRELIAKAKEVVKDGE